MAFLEKLKLIESNWLANLSLWGVLLTPLFFIANFRVLPNFGKGLWFFSVGAIFIFSAFFTLDWQKIKTWFRQPLVWILSSWLFIILLSFIFSINKYVSFWGNPERLGGFLTAIYIFLLVFILLGHLYKHNAMRILSLMGVIGGVVGLHAIGQKLGLDPFWPSFERPVATFGNPIFMSTVLVMTVFISLYFMLASKQVWRKIIYGVLFLAQIIALFLAMSRGPVIGLIVGLAIFVISFLRIKYTNNKIKFWKIIGIFVLGFSLILCGLYVNKKPLGIERLFNYSLSEQSTIKSRISIIESIFTGAQERPLLGFGPENIYVAYNKAYQSVAASSNYAETFADRAHSVVIDKLASTGWLGLVIMLIFVIALIIYGLKWIKAARSLNEKILAITFLTIFISYFIQDLVEFDIITNYVYGSVLVSLFLVFSMLKKTESINKYKPKSINIVLGILFAGLTVYALFGIYIPSWKGGLATKQAFEVYSYENNYNKAYELYNKAFAIKSPYAHWYLKENYPNFISHFANLIFKDNPDETSFILDDSIKRMQQFIIREPQDIQARLGHASLNVILDDLLEGRKEGDRLFSKLIEENPNREFFYVFWGKSLFLSGRVQDAREKIIKSMSFGSVPDESYFWLGVIEASLKNESGALSNFEKLSDRGMRKIDSINHIEFALNYLLDREKYFESIIFQKRLTEINPKELQYWLNLAVLYRDTGQTIKAKQTAANILSIFPKTRSDVLNFISSL